MGNVLATGIDYMKEPLSDSRRVTAKSILKLTPKKEHHNTTFTCQAQNTADRTYRSAKLKLEVIIQSLFDLIAHHIGIGTTLYAVSFVCAMMMNVCLCYIREMAGNSEPAAHFMYKVNITRIQPCS